MAIAKVFIVGRRHCEACQTTWWSDSERSSCSCGGGRLGGAMWVLNLANSQNPDLQWPLGGWHFHESDYAIGVPAGRAVSYEGSAALFCAVGKVGGT